MAVSEDELLAAITRVSKKLAKQFAFAYYEEADIRQEIAVMAIEAAPRFEPDKGSLYTFLLRHCYNRLLNLKRDKCARYKSPCVCCAHMNGLCVKYGSVELCPKYTKWTATNSSKRNLAEGSNCEHPEIADDETGLKPETSEYITIIDKNLPVSLRADYRRYVEGAKLSKKRQQRVEDAIKEVLRAHRE